MRVETDLEIKFKSKSIERFCINRHCRSSAIHMQKCRISSKHMFSDFYQFSSFLLMSHGTTIHILDLR